MEAIRSASNPLIKRVRAVRRGREPGTLLLEGQRLCEEALARGFRPQCLLVSDRRPERLAAFEQLGASPRAVEERLFQTLGALTGAPDVLGLFAAPASRPLDELPDAPEALIAVSGGLQDPGNLGGLARSAEAAGAAALVVLPEGCRPWNEKALRGSMGSLLRLPVFEAEPRALLAALERLGYRHVLARTRGGAPLRGFDWSGRVALWVTDEKGELPAAVAPSARQWAGITIPMAAGVESLNVAVAASILLFEAGRVTPPGAGESS